MYDSTHSKLLDESMGENMNHIGFPSMGERKSERFTNSWDKNFEKKWK